MGQMPTGTIDAENLLLENSHASRGYVSVPLSFLHLRTSRAHHDQNHWGAMKHGLHILVHIIYPDSATIYAESLLDMQAGLGSAQSQNADAY